MSYRIIPGDCIDFIEVEPTHCWMWQRAISPNGYGAKSAGNRRMGRAHRLIYEELVGPIPEGLHLDHLCRNRACVNPGHLEPVTQAENNRRSGRLTRDLVDRARAEGWTSARLASEANVHSTTAWRALVGRTWGDE